MDRAYLCIDLKCFYASVECVDRGRDPFEHRLVVADPSRGRKTICLAISPAMKALGVHNRCRVFEIPDGIDYEMARPRMRHYMEVSADIYARYLRYFSPEDIHVYSIDEVFIDVTPYLALYGKTARELAIELIDMVRRETGICATAGIGTNLFLAKVALDVTAKHAPDNIGELDEERYKCLIWPHRPITDIWGIEPCTMAEIHAYRPKAHSMGSGQVLMRDYTSDEARVVLREMVDNLALELVDKALVCGHVSLYVGYAHERGPADEKDTATETFTGEHGTRVVGRRGEGANASRKLAEATSSRETLTAAFLALFSEIVDPNRSVRRVNISVGELVPEKYAELTLFSDPAADTAEKSLARATMAVKRRFGKNALLRGISYRPEATGRERNEQVGGHHE